MKKTINKIISWLGLTGVISSILSFYLLFASAYFAPSKKTILWIDKYGEANLEGTILLFLLPFIVYTLYYSIINIKNEK